LQLQVRIAALTALQTSIITNDGQRQSLIWLLECKNIFAKQLPKMPKDYITRLVFDKYAAPPLSRNSRDRFPGIE
jgi:hypothetical protein